MDDVSDMDWSYDRLHSNNAPTRVPLVASPSEPSYMDFSYTGPAVIFGHDEARPEHLSAYHEPSPEPQAKPEPKHFLKDGTRGSLAWNKTDEELRLQSLHTAQAAPTTTATSFSLNRPTPSARLNMPTTSDPLPTAPKRRFEHISTDPVDVPAHPSHRHYVPRSTPSQESTSSLLSRIYTKIETMAGIAAISISKTVFVQRMFKAIWDSDSERACMVGVSSGGNKRRAVSMPGAYPESPKIERQRVDSPTHFSTPAGGNEAGHGVERSYKKTTLPAGKHIHGAIPFQGSPEAREAVLRESMERCEAAFKADSKYSQSIHDNGQFLPSIRGRFTGPNDGKISSSTSASVKDLLALTQPQPNTMTEVRIVDQLPQKPEDAPASVFGGDQSKIKYREEEPSSSSTSSASSFENNAFDSHSDDASNKSAEDQAEAISSSIKQDASNPAYDEKFVGKGKNAAYKISINKDDSTTASSKTSVYKDASSSAPGDTVVGNGKGAASKAIGFSKTNITTDASNTTSGDTVVGKGKNASLNLISFSMTRFKKDSSKRTPLTTEPTTHMQAAKQPTQFTKKNWSPAPPKEAVTDDLKRLSITPFKPASVDLRHGRKPQLTQLLRDPTGLLNNYFTGDELSETPRVSERRKGLRAAEEQKKIEAQQKAKAEKARKEAEKRAAAEAKKKEEEEVERAKKAINLIKRISPDLSQKIDLSLDKHLNTELRTNLVVRDLTTLVPDPTWLNDEIVNAYLGDLVKRSLEKRGYTAEHKRNGKAPPVHNVSSFWYSTIKSKGVNGVLSWNKRSKLSDGRLLQCERVFIPICEDAHWRLIVVSGTSRTIEYYDSLGFAGTMYVQKAVEWVKASLGDKYEEGEWTLINKQSSPRQQNGSDCGVFTCVNALALAMGLEVTPGLYDNSVANMLAARRQIAATLLANGFGGELDW